MKTRVRFYPGTSGISANTLDGWVRKFQSGKWSLGSAAVSTAKIGPSAKQPNGDQVRIQDLERQLRRLTMERDILKKAVDR